MKLSLLAATILFSSGGFSYGEELFIHKGTSINTEDNYHCEKSVDIKLIFQSKGQVLKSRNDLQELSNMTKTYLWLDCNSIEEIRYNAIIKGNKEPIYQATAKKQDNWSLNNIEKMNTSSQSSMNSEQTSIDKESPDATTSPKDDYATQEGLERAGQRGSDNALIRLAKGLLSLPEADKNIQFENDKEKGLEILSALAAKGDQDAKHLLGQAYLSDPALKPDMSLLKSISRQFSKSPTTNRQDIAGQLTVEAAAKGSREAIEALNNAGQEGSSMAYYALALMYLFDEQEEMPIDGGFLTNELGFEETENDSLNTAGIGQHFLRLAAQKGNSEALKVLKDLGETTNSSKRVEQKNTDNRVSTSLEQFDNQRLSETIEKAQTESNNSSQGPKKASGKSGQTARNGTGNNKGSTATTPKASSATKSKAPENAEETSSQQGPSHKVIEMFD